MTVAEARGNTQMIQGENQRVNEVEPCWEGSHPWENRLKRCELLGTFLQCKGEEGALARQVFDCSSGLVAGCRGSRQWTEMC